MLRPSTLHPSLFFQTDLSEQDLSGSPMATNGMKLLQYAHEHGGIPLTKTYRNFHRKCVEWAAAEFSWPGFESAELYGVNKVLNEFDFPPLAALHEVFLDARFMRHRGGKAILTKAGTKMLGQYGELQAELTEWLLVSPMGDGHAANDAFWNLRHMLGVIGNRLGDWVDTGAFTEWAIPIELYPDAGPLGQRYEANLFISVNLIRPLCWLGLLEEAKSNRPITPVEKREVRKTLLFDLFVKFVELHDYASGTVH